MVRNQAAARVAMSANEPPFGGKQGGITNNPSSLQVIYFEITGRDEGFLFLQNQ